MSSSGISRSAAEAPSRADQLTPTHRAILYAVLYAEVFDSPMPKGELERFLPRVEGLESKAMLPGRVAELTQHEIDSRDGYFFWSGKSRLVAEGRRRQQESSPLWKVAERYANCLRSVPFVRMVAVCGSLTMENCDQDGDVDIFIVAADRRLWIVHTYAMLLRRVVGWRSVKVCPNYLLTESSLETRTRSLFTAREIAQVVPLWGSATYDRFMSVNRWISSYLPFYDLRGRRERLQERPAPRLQRTAEKLLGGPLGDRLDAALHAVLLRYFARRWSALDADADHVRKAYLRDRQEVVGGGYGAAIEQRFEQLVSRRLAISPPVRAELNELFPPVFRGHETVPRFEQLFEARYKSSQ